MGGIEILTYAYYLLTVFTWLFAVHYAVYSSATRLVTCNFGDVFVMGTEEFLKA